MTVNYNKSYGRRKVGIYNFFHNFRLWKIWRDLTDIVCHAKQTITASPVIKKGVICLYERGKKRAMAALASICMVLMLLTPQAHAQSGERTVIPLGKAVGIKLFAEGALVVAVENNAVLQKGDLLLTLDGEAVSSTEKVQSILEENGGDTLTMAVQRGQQLLTLQDTPQRGSDGVWRLGVWIRDSMAGVGTLTYYDPSTNTYAALGHGITDVDTSQLMTLHSGAVMPTVIRAVNRGAPGVPGELKGDFSIQRDVGLLTANTQKGIFGTAADGDFFTGEPMAVAAAGEVLCGEATILATVSGEETKPYSIAIRRVYESGHQGRDMLIEVTDPALLAATGGIVQGMSGSPIIQNGKLIGAVTHVLIDDPARGYGIFIENMMKAAE